jgi:hypothetical protein
LIGHHPKHLILVRDRRSTAPALGWKSKWCSASEIISSLPPGCDSKRLQAVGDVTPLGTDRSQNALSVGRWQVINDATHAGDDVIDHAIWASSIGADLTEVPRSLTFITA